MQNVYAAEYTISVTKYSQEKSNWCWAACARMVGKYHGRDVSQTSICRAVKGSVVNDPASLNEITSAIRYAANRPVSRGGISAFSTHLAYLKTHKKARVIRMEWNNGKGHVYVVSGTKEATSTTPASIRLIDPIAGNVTKYYSHANLVSGTGRYTHTWTPS